MGSRAVFWMVLLSLGSFAFADPPKARVSGKRITEVTIIFGKLKKKLRPRGGSQERQLRDLAAQYSREDFEALETVVGNYFTHNEAEEIPFQYKVAAVRAVLDYCVIRRELAIEEMKMPGDVEKLTSLRQELQDLEAELHHMSQQSKAFRQVSLSD